MTDNTVIVDRSVQPTGLLYSPRFNAAIPFIDRHGAEGEISYAALADNVARCGNTLLGLGIARGARLLMAVKDCPEFFYLFWGAIKAGIVPVPLNTMLRAADYQFLIEDSQCGAIAYSPEFAAAIEAALAQLANPPSLVLPVAGEGRTLRSLIGLAPAVLEAAPAISSDECFWLYSSGSTGRPKGAVHRQQDMVVSSQLYGVDVLGMGEDDVCFSAAKPFFAYGLGNAIQAPLTALSRRVIVSGRIELHAVFPLFFVLAGLGPAKTRNEGTSLQMRSNRLSQAAVAERLIQIKYSARGNCQPRFRCQTQHSIASMPAITAIAGRMP